tara:strand:+ start:139 stop:462 length:324 start_codon:yes stop_codon:yes gene_type:complete
MNDVTQQAFDMADQGMTTDQFLTDRGLPQGGGMITLTRSELECLLADFDLVKFKEYTTEFAKMYSSERTNIFDLIEGAKEMEEDRLSDYKLGDTMFQSLNDAKPWRR